MNVVVDTAVWSVAFRRAASQLNAAQTALVEELRDLIDEGRVVMVGVIRQELLSGIRRAADFTRLRDHLRSFPDLPLETADFEQAAEINNACRAAGVAATSIDVLLCAVAQRRSCALFTTDNDFQHYARVIPLSLHEPR